MEDNDSEENSNNEEKPKHMVRIQYRGKISDDYRKALRHLDASCVVVLTLRILKTTLPSMNVEVEKALKSRVVYKLVVHDVHRAMLVKLTAIYWYVLRSILRPSQPVRKHLRLCDTAIESESKESVSNLHQTYGSILHLISQNALWIR